MYNPRRYTAIYHAKSRKENRIDVRVYIYKLRAASAEAAGRLACLFNSIIVHHRNQCALARTRAEAFGFNFLSEDGRFANVGFLLLRAA